MVALRAGAAAVETVERAVVATAAEIAGSAPRAVVVSAAVASEVVVLTAD